MLWKVFRFVIFMIVFYILYIFLNWLAHENKRIVVKIKNSLKREIIKAMMNQKLQSLVFKSLQNYIDNECHGKQRGTFITLKYNTRNRVSTEKNLHF